MKKFKVESKCLIINIEVPVKVGEVELIHLVGITYDGEKNTEGIPTWDQETFDYMNVTFHGKKAEISFAMLREFYEHMKVNIDDEIRNATNEILTKADIIEILSNVKI